MRQRSSALNSCRAIILGISERETLRRSAASSTLTARRRLVPALPPLALDDGRRPVPWCFPAALLSEGKVMPAPEGVAERMPSPTMARTSSVVTPSRSAATRTGTDGGGRIGRPSGRRGTSSGLNAPSPGPACSTMNRVCQPAEGAGSPLARMRSTARAVRVRGCPRLQERRGETRRGTGGPDARCNGRRRMLTAVGGPVAVVEGARRIMSKATGPVSEPPTGTAGPPRSAPLPKRAPPQ